MKYKRKTKAWKVVLLCAAIIFVGLNAAVFIISSFQNRSITVARYTVESPRIENGFRIVLISDLHELNFDETNQTIVDLVAEQKPDVIAVDGDMVNGDCTADELEELFSLLERLVDIAPVYYVPGNHDYTLYSADAVFLGPEASGLGEPSETLEMIRSTGAVFLEQGFADTIINGDAVRIGGFYPLAYRSIFDTDESWAERSAFLEGFCDTDSFRLMLSHRPNSYYGEKDYPVGEVPSWDIDLVLSGHEHNGVIALPFSHRAIWTHEGLFPKHAYGDFYFGDMRMIVTSGFAGYRFIPRVFNPPEIAVVDIVPEG